MDYNPLYDVLSWLFWLEAVTVLSRHTAYGFQNKQSYHVLEWPVSYVQLRLQDMVF